MTESTSSAPAGQSFASSLSKFSYQSPFPPTRKPPNTSAPLPTSKRRLTRSSTRALTTITSHPSASPRRSPPKKPRNRRAPTPTSAPLTNHLTDSLAPNLLLLSIGVNPGLQTAATGHAYAHPSNLYWKLLHASGLTHRRCAPTEDQAMPRLYGIGHTNIVSRPTRDASMLGAGEMDAGVAGLEEKCRVWRPEAVVLVGKGVWEAVWRVWRGRGLGRGEFGYGWQGVRMGGVEGWEGAWVFVATTTSGLAAGMGWAEKVEVWRELGGWVEGRRRERVRKGEVVGEEVRVEGEGEEGKVVEGGERSGEGPAE